LRNPAETRHRPTFIIEYSAPVTILFERMLPDTLHAPFGAIVGHTGPEIFAATELNHTLD